MLRVFLNLHIDYSGYLSKKDEFVLDFFIRFLPIQIIFPSTGTDAYMTILSGHSFPLEKILFLITSLIFALPILFNWS